MERFHFYSHLVKDLLDRLNKAYDKGDKKRGDSLFLQIQALLSKQEYMFKEKEDPSWTDVPTEVLERKYKLP